MYWLGSPRTSCKHLNKLTRWLQSCTFKNFLLLTAKMKSNIFIQNAFWCLYGLGCGIYIKGCLVDIIIKYFCVDTRRHPVTSDVGLWYCNAISVTEQFFAKASRSVWYVPYMIDVIHIKTTVEEILPLNEPVNALGFAPNIITLTRIYHF